MPKPTPSQTVGPFFARDLLWKDGGIVLFPGGSDRREFWQRAEDRNRNTARTYDQLGLPEFYALEGFVQWRD